MNISDVNIRDLYKGAKVLLFVFCSCKKRELKFCTNYYILLQKSTKKAFFINVLRGT